VVEFTTALSLLCFVDGFRSKEFNHVCLTSILLLPAVSTDSLARASSSGSVGENIGGEQVVVVGIGGELHQSETTSILSSSPRVQVEEEEKNVALVDVTSSSSSSFSS